MKYVAELEKALQELPGLAEKILPLARPAVILEKQFESFQVDRKPLLGLFKQRPQIKRRGLPVSPGCSRLGGLPDLPEGATWPERDGKPMQFVAKINCAELAEFRGHTQLPADGVLQFFFEEDGVESSVLFTAVGMPLQTSPAPSGCSVKFVLPQFPVTFSSIPTFPHAETTQFEKLGLSEEAVELLLNAQGELAAMIRAEQHGLHQIGGYPEAIQGDVFTECEMIDSQKFPTAKTKDWALAAERAHGWRLLLQFDTDGDLEVMWGDAGMIYFCIREADLQAGRFEKVVSTGQCG